MELTREQALALLRQYNEEPFHLRHALTVEAVMNWFARELGYGEEAAFWAQAGLLHDLDFERYPEEHCVKVREIMEARGLDSALIHAVVSHGWGMTEGDAQPEHEMERVLFAVDELTGLIGAAALMRPSKSVQDMELSSLRKKFKDKKFAAGCSRETITQGAQLLGWELNDLLERTLHEGLRGGHRSPVRRPLRSTKKDRVPRRGYGLFVKRRWPRWQCPPAPGRCSVRGRRCAQSR